MRFRFSFVNDQPTKKPNPTLKLFKILLGVVLLSTVLFVSIISVNKTEKLEKSTLSITTEQIRIKREKNRIYQLRKLRLQNAISQYFKKAINSGSIVGAGVSIVQGDSILFSNGFGKRDIENDARVNGETVFRLGSISKGFAGVLTADLKEEGKLDWNDKITNYIPEFHFGTEKNTSQIQLAHILSHTSGTPYHSFTNLIEAGLPVSSISERFSEVKPIGKPGQVYSYQNAMFSLCQEVIKKVTGEEINMALKNRFFKPLGMSTVSMDHTSIMKNENVALPHAKRKKGWKKLLLNKRYYNAVAAGGINASSLDMAKWMRFLLGHNPEVMNKSALKEVFKPFVALKGHSKYYQKWSGHIASGYGFGWRIHEMKHLDTKNNFKVYHHGGSVNNYRNEIALFPESDLGICVLINNNTRFAKTVIPDLHAIVKKVYKATREVHAIPNSYAVVP